MISRNHDADQQPENYSEYEGYFDTLGKWIHSAFDDVLFAMSADDRLSMSTFVNYFEDDILEMVRQEIGKYKE